MEEAASRARAGGPIVVFIMGYSRSGSTILASILGQVDGFVEIGELHHCWRALIEGKGKCGCSRQAVDCPVWGKVFEDLVPERGGEKWLTMMEKQVEQANRPWRFLRAVVRGHGDQRQIKYARLLSKLYHRIQLATGARVIVDSSKDPWFGALAALAGDVEVRFVHIVRDPRGVYYSRARREGPESRRGLAEIGAAARVSLGWVVTNLAAPWVRRFGGPAYVRIGYETMVAQPEKTLSGLLAGLGFPGASLPLVDELTVRIAAGHSIAGNRSRFRTGLVALAADDAWKTGLKPTAQRTINLLAGPWWRKFGPTPYGSQRAESQ